MSKGAAHCTGCFDFTHAAQCPLVIAPYADCGHGITLIDVDHLPRNGMLVKEQCELACIFGGGMAEDGDGFHGLEI